MTQQQTVQVVPYGEVWAVDALGVRYVEFATQEMAIKFGEIQAKKHDVELIVQSKDSAEVVSIDTNPEKARTAEKTNNEGRSAA